MVTTLYDGPLPWAWFMYQSRRASSPSARIGIQPSRNAASNSSSVLADDLVHLVDEQHHATRCSSGNGDQGDGAEQLALPPVAQLERIVHPRARGPHLGRDVAGEQAEQTVGIEDALHERDLALAVRTERGLEAGFDLGGTAVLPSRGAPAMRVHGARRVDVVEQPALVRPHRVLHVHGRFVFGAVGRAPRRGRGRPSATRAAGPAPCP